jgi:hypothetical protein
MFTWRFVAMTVIAVEHDLAVACHPMLVELPEDHSPIPALAKTESLRCMNHLLIG